MCPCGNDSHVPAQGVILLLTCGLRRGELLGLQWQDVDLEDGIMKIRHTLSRLKKFDVSKSAYPYIRLDAYAPETNRTALYLGPVKTKKAVRTIYLPARAKEALLVIREISTEFADVKSDFNPHDLVFCTEEGHPFEAKVLEEGFQKILPISTSKALTCMLPGTPLQRKPCKRRPI